VRDILDTHSSCKGLQPELHRDACLKPTYKKSAKPGKCEVSKL
jgi:hypothetical protein